jgi:transposase
MFEEASIYCRSMGAPTGPRYRCEACGNKTRFDVEEVKRLRSFHHFTLGGELTVEDEEVLERTVERVVCRWCGSGDAIVSEPEPM